MITSRAELLGIAELLSLYPAIARYTLGKEITNHEMRILFAIYYIKETDIKPLSRRRLSSLSYFWPNVARTGCDSLIKLGLLEPLKKPNNHLFITDQGYTIIREILFNARSLRASLTNPVKKKTVNRPKKRS